MKTAPSRRRLGGFLSTLRRAESSQHLNRLDWAGSPAETPTSSLQGIVRWSEIRPEKGYTARSKVRIFWHVHAALDVPGRENPESRQCLTGSVVHAASSGGSDRPRGQVIVFE